MSSASIAAAVVVGLRAVHVMNRLIDTVGISTPDMCSKVDGKPGISCWFTWLIRKNCGVSNLKCCIAVSCRFTLELRLRLYRKFSWVKHDSRTSSCFSQRDLESMLPPNIEKLSRSIWMWRVESPVSIWLLNVTLCWHLCWHTLRIFETWNMMKGSMLKLTAVIRAVFKTPNWLMIVEKFTTQYWIHWGLASTHPFSLESRFQPR